MPKDEAPRSRGSGPGGDQRKLRPTVIGATGVRTRVPATEARQAARTDTRSPVAKGPAITKPTAIPGVERKRIAVVLADLRKLAPQARPGVVQDALELVQSIVADSVRDRQAVMWGYPLQQQHSDLVSRTLALSQSEALNRVAGYIGRMTDILGAIDIEAICGIAPTAGILGRYLKGMNRRIDTAEELGTARVELDQLLRLVGDSLDPLLQLKETLERHAAQVEELADAAEASAIAAAFLSDHWRGSQPGIADRFLERSMSLTQTVAQIRGSAAMREVQIEQPLRLIAAIQNVALVMVPGWLGSLAALTTMLASDRQPTPTQAGEYAYRLRDILQQLKS